MKTLFALLLLFNFSLVSAGDRTIRGTEELRAALRDLKPGTTLRLAPGNYDGGYHVRGIANLTITALDTENPPHFKGGANSWHFSRCEGLTLSHLRISGQSGNGLNLDDGGELDSLVGGITLENLEISEIGPQGNHDGIKCSGLENLTIRSCRITAWGGQGIDFVGCHRALITGCRFEGREGFSASAGIQLKGGTTEVIVEKCHFLHAGERPLNIGGSTGLPYFRPPGGTFEAARIIVRENHIEGGLCAAAFAGVDGAEFTNNTILYPERWIFRILQETTEPGFVPCRNVTIAGNRIVFRRSQLRTDMNIGGNTAPETFVFEGNQWFAEDRPEASQPQLPVEETDGIYGRDPR
jgi:polygalacturonase